VPKPLQRRCPSVTTAGIHKATPAVLSEPRASPRGRNSERNLGEKFHTGCAGQATLTRSSTTGNVRYPGFLAEDLVLALPKETLSDFGCDFTTCNAGKSASRADANSAYVARCGRGLQEEHSRIQRKIAANSLRALNLGHPTALFLTPRERYNLSNCCC
jgi:hypothetical protein